jgi:hypothetical protein
MSKTKGKTTPKTRKKRKTSIMDASNVVIVRHTTEKETLFPEKLKKVNEMLKNCKMLDSQD